METPYFVITAAQARGLAPEVPEYLLKTLKSAFCQIERKSKKGYEEHIMKIPAKKFENYILTCCRKGR